MSAPRQRGRLAPLPKGWASLEGASRIKAATASRKPGPSCRYPTACDSGGGKALGRSTSQSSTPRCQSRGGREGMRRSDTVGLAWPEEGRRR